MTVVLRTAQNPLTLAEPVRNAISSIDKGVAIAQVRSFDQVIANALWQSRFTTVLTGVFATFALLLAVTGIYALMTWLAASRSREIGIRLAMGATRTAVIASIVRQGAVLALAGAGVGLAAALALGRTLAGLVYGVSTADPVTFVAAPAIVVSVALFAVAVPAIRASAVDPAQTLRSV
ncbi:MAG: FtsX-like permease family protein [Acidobacteriaceae bacterium]|nr:FtsX-like permease family protein [Acidobacteriaceae bacterium]